MARHRRQSRKQPARGLAYASAVGGLASRYHQAKREYHHLGDALFKSRKRRSKSRRSR